MIVWYMVIFLSPYFRWGASAVIPVAYVSFEQCSANAKAIKTAGGSSFYRGENSDVLVIICVPGNKL